MALCRPLVSVINAAFKESGEPSLKLKKTMVRMPDVFKTPLRDDVVKHVFHQMARNSRQAFGVSKLAGVQCSAESWGTGRAISRIPRVRGSGTHRTGQGAYGNMCRGGHMFSPRVVWRRWHRKINLRQKRYAMAVAVAATGLPSLVMARGHRVGKVSEFPLVFDYNSSTLTRLSKTKYAAKLLKKLGADGDVQHCKESTKIRPGKGKMRNRRYVMRKGPLIIHTFASSHPFVRSFKNIPGVELMNVKRLNLLKLAPGAKLGRFVIWTKRAFTYLRKIFHRYSSTRALKHGEVRPQPMVEMPDIGKIISSDAVQKVMRHTKSKPRHARKRINPLKNAHKMHELNPFARELRRRAILRQMKVKKVRTEQAEKRLAILKKMRKEKLKRKLARIAKDPKCPKPQVRRKGVKLTKEERKTARAAKLASAAPVSEEIKAKNKAEAEERRTRKAEKLEKIRLARKMFLKKLRKASEKKPGNEKESEKEGKDKVMKKSSKKSGKRIAAKKTKSSFKTTSKKRVLKKKSPKTKKRTSKKVLRNATSS